MLSERVKDWSQHWLEQGIEKGREQGIEQGRELSVRTLKRLLTKRFGDLPDAICQQIDTASLAQLETWFDRGLEADTLGAVFN